jgi:hypothetical protein
LKSISKTPRIENIFKNAKEMEKKKKSRTDKKNVFRYIIRNIVRCATNIEYD